jgi:hypothetical protein
MHRFGLFRRLTQAGLLSLGVLLWGNAAMHAQGCADVSAQVRASVARLNKLVGDKTLTQESLNREIRVLEDLSKEQASCVVQVPSTPKVSPEAPTAAKRPRPEEMMERTLRTHQGVPTPEAGAPRGTRSDSERLDAFISRLKPLASRTPPDIGAVSEVLRAAP